VLTGIYSLFSTVTKFGSVSKLLSIKVSMHYISSVHMAYEKVVQMMALCCFRGLLALEIFLMRKWTVRTVTMMIMLGLMMVTVKNRNRRIRFQKIKVIFAQ